MPVPGFLSSIADKAQIAIQSSPLVQHIPGHGRPTSPDAAAQPSANDAAQGPGHGSSQRSHAFEAISHQFRTLQQQYGSTSPVQKLITTGKGVAIDFDSVSRDAKAQSKELYMWGQTEHNDLKDVTDRLAYLNFVQGSLASSLSLKMDAARGPLKALRDAETAIAPRRNIRASLRTQIARVEHDQQKGMEKKLAELKDQLRKAEAEDSSSEAEIELLKRQGIKASESLKFEALREYGEKLVLVSQAAASLVEVLPAVPPTDAKPYTGGQRTGSIRASLQRALDNYKTGHINLPPQSAASDLSRSDTVSFGESHASELDSISTSSMTAQPGIPLTPPPGGRPVSELHKIESLHAKNQSPPINPAHLNLNPASIPPPSAGAAGSPGALSSSALSSSALSPINDATSTTSPVPIAAPDPTKPTTILPGITPTIAETGVPLSSTDPGPASGSLRDVRAPASSSTTVGATHSAAPPKWESAEDEKKRLATGYSQVYGQPPPAAALAAHEQKHETAEEEKKRLEREERERLLLGDGSHDPSGGKKDKDEDLPPYQDM